MFSIGMYPRGASIYDHGAVPTWKAELLLVYFRLFEGNQKQPVITNGQAFAEDSISQGPGPDIQSPRLITSTQFPEIPLQPAMLKSVTHQAIALAGLFQTLLLVRQIARQGNADPDDMETAVSSTLKIDADDVPDVYGGVRRLAKGLRQLERQLAGPGQMDVELARYASTLLFLERKLLKQPAMVETIGVSVHRAAEQVAELGLMHEKVFQTLAEAYQETLSRLEPRVLVAGEQSHLANPENTRKIRTLLLAGIRSAVLWRQCGGARWKLLVNRGALQRETHRLIVALP